jgi:hypothetical protein
MAKFAVFFSYKAETWDRMLKNPGTGQPPYGTWRQASAAPSRRSTSCSAIAMASASLMFRSRRRRGRLHRGEQHWGLLHMETHQLIAPEDLQSVLEKAARAKAT